MTTFEDGPAKGATLLLSRAPLLLRVVKSASGEIDALDLIGDEPREGEEVTVYFLASDVTTAFVDGRDNHGKRWGKRVEAGSYRVFDRQPGAVDVADRERWQQWCKDHADHARRTHSRLVEQDRRGA